MFRDRNFATLFPSLNAIKSSNRPETVESRRDPRRRDILVAFVKCKMARRDARNARKICDRFYGGSTRGVDTSLTCNFPPLTSDFIPFVARLEVHRVFCKIPPLRDLPFLPFFRSRFSGSSRSIENPSLHHDVLR